jgi:hypothetical protein
MPIWPEAAAEGSSDAERQTGLRIWKVPEDSVFRAKVAEAIGVEDLLLPEQPALTEEQVSVVFGYWRTRSGTDAEGARQNWLTTLLTPDGPCSSTCPESCRRNQGKGFSKPRGAYIADERC